MTSPPLPPRPRGQILFGKPRSTSSSSSSSSSPSSPLSRPHPSVSRPLSFHLRFRFRSDPAAFQDVVHRVLALMHRQPPPSPSSSYGSRGIKKFLFLEPSSFSCGTLPQRNFELYYWKVPQVRKLDHFRRDCYNPVLQHQPPPRARSHHFSWPESKRLRPSSFPVRVHLSTVFENCCCDK